MGEKIYVLVLITLPIHIWAFALVPKFWDWLRNNPGRPKEYIDQIEKDNPHNDLINVTAGILERIFFAIVIAFNLSGGVVAMIGWATLKMATNWNKAFPKIETKKWSIEQKTQMALCSLHSGLLSLFFALISGLIFNLSLDWVKSG